VTGASKAAMLKRVFEEPYRPQEYPAQLLSRAAGSVTWLVDEAAAAILRAGS
jgi:6-phosphogluconolactonase/glucosamine-6-phosphate isomerase/deaminase